MGDKKSDKDIRNYIYSEQYGLFEAVYSAIEKNRWLNNWENSSIGKYKQLLIAQNIGLKIPNSAIVNTKKQMLEFVEQNANVIIKPIQDMSPIEIDGNHYFQYTKSLKNKDIRKLKKTFFPCLLQKEIDKNLEIRVFYIITLLFMENILTDNSKQKVCILIKYINGEKLISKIVAMLKMNYSFIINPSSSNPSATILASTARFASMPKAISRTVQP